MLMETALEGTVVIDAFFSSAFAKQCIGIGCIG